MKNKVMLFLGVLAIGCVSVLIIMYFALAVYYMDGFTYNTRINGVYCTGKSVDEVNQELKDCYATSDVIINSEIGEEKIARQTIGFDIDFTNYLKRLQKNQNAFLWIENLFTDGSNRKMDPEVIFDDQLLDNQIQNLKIVNAFGVQRDYKVEICKNSDGYYLFDNTEHNLNVEMLKEAIIAVLSTNQPLEVDDTFFFDQELSSDMKKTRNLWLEVDRYLDCGIVYDMGTEKIPISRSIMSQFLVRDGDSFTRDENGTLHTNEEEILAFVNKLADQYDTYGKERSFLSAKGIEKTITWSIYGTKINRQKEYEYLLEAILNRRSEEHIPEYLETGFVRGLDDIGDTYIEIDLTEQKLYFIKDGTLKFEYDVVTGKPASGDATPSMVCYVYKKQENRVLRGEGYASPVDYWMPVYRNIGIHDAKWQRAFGGKRYLTHGSHGCINMKTEEAKELYESIEVGIPVLIYK